ncbi:hypothetical protein HMI55_005266 [Coelomomyces lativittatus]|nr:hypothetical protein HMI55_005266 [Coelomomyces lativittatus]
MGKEKYSRGYKFGRCLFKKISKKKISIFFFKAEKFFLQTFSLLVFFLKAYFVLTCVYLSFIFFLFFIFNGYLEINTDLSLSQKPRKSECEEHIVLFFFFLKIK